MPLSISILVYFTMVVIYVVNMLVAITLPYMTLVLYCGMLVITGVDVPVLGGIVILQEVDKITVRGVRSACVHEIKLLLVSLMNAEEPYLFHFMNIG